jgi:hypothetical protein
MSKLVEKIDNSTIRITTTTENGTSILILTVEQLTNRKQVLEQRLQMFDARKESDRAMLSGRLQQEEDLIAEATIAGCIFPE